MPRISLRHRYASLADAAAYVDVDERTIRRWIAAGLLAGYRLGQKTIRVDLIDVDEALCRPIPAAKAGRS